MYEFDIYNNQTKENHIIFGYTLKDAFKRNPTLNPKDWVCLGYEYID